MSEIAVQHHSGTTDLEVVQLRRKRAFLIAGIAAALLLPFSASVWRGDEAPHETIELFGVLMIGAAIIGRTWCALYIGGRKAREIVAAGPYSVSRNPLYLFSLIAVAGIGIQTGSIAAGAVLFAIALAIFLPVIIQEERVLAESFGAEYAAYCARVPRFGPKLSGWRDLEVVSVNPIFFWRTLREALLFLLVIPLCEGVEWLQQMGYLVPVIHLP